MAYRKINYTPEALERRKLYQREYQRAKWRTPEGRTYKEKLWGAYHGRIGVEARRAQARKGTFYWRCRQMGVDPETVVKLMEMGCMICGTKQTKIRKRHRLCIDHDHGTGEFRGILCHSCNVGIGCFSDDPEQMQKAIRYLKGKL